jgi:hypothetical protein
MPKEAPGQAARKRLDTKKQEEKDIKMTEAIPILLKAKDPSHSAQGLKIYLIENKQLSINNHAGCQTTNKICFRINTNST